MREANKYGYRIFFVYVSLTNPELHIERVRLRVSQGGHNIPDSDIRRRYARSINHAPEALRIADEAVVVDNSGIEPERMLVLQSGQIVWTNDLLPDWVQRISKVLNPDV